MITTYNPVPTLKILEQLKPRVYALLKQIPAGKVASYKTLAQVLGVNPRQIGQALHQNTDPDNNPCHRVIHSDGSLAGGYVFGGPNIQRHLLEAEGVKFDQKGQAKKKFFVANLNLD